MRYGTNLTCVGLCIASWNQLLTWPRKYLQDGHVCTDGSAVGNQMLPSEHDSRIVAGKLSTKCEWNSIKFAVSLNSGSSVRLPGREKDERPA